jgi:outer membrane receptor for ferrienterochelin and colicin
MKRYLLCLIILSSFAAMLSGGTTGKIRGTITDSANEPLVGANVVVEGTMFGAATDTEGRFIILNVQPGKYTLQISMIGYKRLNITNVQVQTDLTTEINEQLEPTVLEAEEVTVVAQRPLIQKDATASAAVISSDVLEAAPVETFQAIVQTKAGVTVDAGGALHVRGGRSNEIAYLVDGVPNINPYHSGLGVDIATNAIQELSVVTGSFSAEYGQAMSGVINIITKEGGSKYRGSVSIMGGDLITDYDIDISSVVQEKAEEFNYMNTNEIETSLSGPIPFLKKMKFYTSVRLNNDAGHIYGVSRYTPYGVEKDSSEWGAFPMNPSDKLNFQTKLSYAPGENLKINYTILYEDSHWKSYTHSRRYIKEGQYHYYKKAINHIFKVTHQISNRSFHALSLSRTDNDYWYHSYDDPYDMRMVAGAYYRNDANYEFYSGGTGNGHYDRNLETTLAKWLLTNQLHDRHELKTGVEFKFHDLYEKDVSMVVDLRDEPWEDSDSNGEYDLGETFTDLDGDGVWTRANDENNNDIPGDIAEAEGGYNVVSQSNPKEYSAFIQDKIELADMVLNIGLRWDYFDTGGRVANDWNDPDPDDTKPATAKQQFSPRFSLAYPVSDRGRLFFSYGHFFQMPPYYRLYHNPGFDVLPGVIKSDIGNADLKPQKTVSYEIGFEHEVGSDAAVFIKLFYRDLRNLLGQRVYLLPGGSDSYALFINRDWGNAKGFTFSFEKRLTNLLSGAVDYTYSVARGNESDPTRTRRDYRLSIEPQKKVVYLTWDQPHAFRFNLNLGRPGNWRISTIGRIESGYPYTPMDANAIIRIAEENSGRKPNQIHLDMNAFKNFALNVGSSEVGYTLFVKVYNLIDRRNENYVHDSSGSARYSLGRYGDISTAEWINRPHYFSEPRRIFAGISVNF